MSPGKHILMNAVVIISLVLHAFWITPLVSFPLSEFEMKFVIGFLLFAWVTYMYHRLCGIFPKYSATSYGKNKQQSTYKKH